MGASSTPTESAVDSAVQDFGIGTYDAQGEGEHTHGEGANEQFTRYSLPDGGGNDVQCPDRLLSYPDENPSIASEISLPGDVDSPTPHQHPNMSTIDNRTTTVAESELPDDHDNPAARSDYYDDTIIGQSVDNIWADEDSGAYASDSDPSSLPGVNKNEVSMDDFLGALGNYWSGYEVEDISGIQGFPATDMLENVDYSKSNDDSIGGRILASKNKSTVMKAKILKDFEIGKITLGELFDIFEGTNTETRLATGRTTGEMIDFLTARSRVATNITLIDELSSEFLREFGRKDLTKRHVLSFLQSKKQPQYLSSDVIRCLKHRHDIHVKDVLDEFPVAKQASTSVLASVRDRIINLEIENIRVPEVSSVLRRAAAALSVAIVRSEKHSG